MSSPDTPAIVAVNGREYRWPARPVVVVCVDGSEPDYIEVGIRGGHLPALAAMRGRGLSDIAYAALPTFTNPNNLSIVTGAPPAVHGVGGNYFYDRESDSEVMLNDPRFLRAETILAAFLRAGARVAAVTAKDKLRRLLGKGIEGALCFSAERADRTTAAEHGIDDALGFVGLPLPDVYSAELSAFVLAAGVRVVERFRPDLVYLSTTDFIQHKYAPDEQGAIAFYRMLDAELGRLDALEVNLVVTADHGMKAKADSAGRPRVVYVETWLEQRYGKGAGRVILPITDPYVRHHGALGSFCTVHLRDDLEAAAVARALMELRGVELALSAAEACALLELPADKMGEVVVFADAEYTLGRTPEHHDLSAVMDRPLRSHGGLREREVPFLTNRPVEGVAAERRLRNYDAFLIGCNHMP